MVCRRASLNTKCVQPLKWTGYGSRSLENKPNKYLIKGCHGGAVHNGSILILERCALFSFLFCSSVISIFPHLSAFRSFWFAVLFIFVAFAVAEGLHVSYNGGVLNLALSPRLCMLSIPPPPPPPSASDAVCGIFRSEPVAVTLLWGGRSPQTPERRCWGWHTVEKHRRRSPDTALGGYRAAGPARPKTTARPGEISISCGFSLPARRALSPPSDLHSKIRRRW